MPPKMKNEKNKKEKKEKKEKKDKKGKKDQTLLTKQDVVFPLSDENEESGEMDYLLDLDDEFFSSANKIIQMLMEHNRLYEASKLKKYVDIIFHLHNKYADEVKENIELRPQIAVAENKLRLALELTSTSEEALERLKEALGSAWKESDASILREQDIQEKLQEILIKCEGFESKEAEKQDDSAEFGHLAKYKNIILRERDRLNGDVMDLEKRLQMHRFYSESLEYIIKNNEDSMNKMSTKVRALEMEKQNLDVKNKNLIMSLEESKELNAKTNQKLDFTQYELHETQSKLSKKITDYERQKLLLEKMRTDNSLHTKQLSKYEDEILELKKDQKNNEEAIRALRLEDKVKTNIINTLNKKLKKSIYDQSSLSTKLYKQNRENHMLNEDIMRLKNQMNALEKDVLNARQRYDDLRRTKENIQRERENLRSDIVKLNNQITDLRHTIVMQTNNNDNLRLDISKLNVKLDEAKISISKADKERDEMAQEVESLHERIEYYQEQLQLKTDQITDLSEKLHQKQTALINMKKQLETVHSEKMALQRTLETCTQERDNFRLLQTKTSHQISQLTNEIATNHNKINSLNLRIEHLNNEKKDLQTELKNKETILAIVRKELREMKHKNENLLKTIDEDELKIMKISTELDETRKEKNLIGLQMVRRNDEIILLKEKLTIMQTALDQGQTQYNQRVEDIRLLKMEITNLQTERNCLQRAIQSTADMRLEIIRLQRSLNQERVRVRSLTEDAKMPTGVHRWRILKGEDPDRFEMITKIQVLQRRYIKQEIEKSNLKLKLEEANKVSNTLKHVVENLPTANVKERLVVTQRINRRQMRKLKSLKAELALQQIEMKARECVIDDFKDDLKKCHEQHDNIAPFPAYYDTSKENLIDCAIQSSVEALPVLQTN